MIKGYQIKISLLDTPSPIWRKVRIPTGLSFEDLHCVIQGAMGWENYHLYEFQTFDGELDTEQTIDDWLESGKTLFYNYDMGDYWEHRIELVKVMQRLPKERGEYPTVLSYRGDCPPEDCGGVEGFYAMKQALDSKKGAAYREVKEWLGGTTLPVYDKEEANKELAFYFSE